MFPLEGQKRDTTEHMCRTSYLSKCGMCVGFGWSRPTTVEIVTEAGKAVENEYWRRMSAAFAYASRGRVYVMLPDETSLGTEWFKGTIWDTVEWPILEESTEVADIFRIGRSLRPPSEGVSIKPQWSTPPRRSEQIGVGSTHKYL